MVSLVAIAIISGGSGGIRRMEPLSRATRYDQSKGKPEPKRVTNPADTITEQMELNQDSIRSDDSTTGKVQ